MESNLPQEAVISKIYEIRSQQVMLDRDLAELYGVETKYLKRQVRRNMIRFPSDFMFEMTKEELKNWRLQNGTSNAGERMGLRYTPFCFTEQGVAMLSGVLKSDRAALVNVQIMRAYSKMRKLILTHKDILLEMEELRKKVGGQDEKIDLIFEYLQQFIQQEEAPRKEIGYKRKDEK
ncbi:MAG: ORF6N domain-containing protein [Flavobacteriales bacterium]|nr:ORF6N domain-containing protein [Flavobacteriales bacterium]